MSDKRVYLRSMNWNVGSSEAGRYPKSVLTCRAKASNFCEKKAEGLWLKKGENVSTGVLTS